MTRTPRLLLATALLAWLHAAQLAWDTRPTADAERDPARRAEPIPGASDGGSGTAVLLHLADVLSRHSPPIGVDLLLVEGEDYAPDHMFLGSTHFAAHAAGCAPLYGVLLDMAGDRSPRFLREGYSRRYAPDVVARVRDVAESIGPGRWFPGEDGRSIGDDHVPPELVFRDG